MNALIDLILVVLQLYRYVLIATIILSWLISFNVINTRNQAVYQINMILNRLTEPLLRPIRRIIPPISGLDFSPLILLLVIFFIERLIIRDIGPYVYQMNL
ncbi:MAG TPA: YggT family protein [Terriglobales bacterium]|jgi:YggT family protein|nr:YggT family protein [Terriglobales bacterium]